MFDLCQRYPPPGRMTYWGVPSQRQSVNTLVSMCFEIETKTKNFLFIMSKDVN